MGGETAEVPVWAFGILWAVLAAVFSGFIKLVYDRFGRLESRALMLEQKTEEHITQERHERDLERIADSHERALERIASKHDKELNGVHKRIDDSFERLETRIAESNKTIHGRLDDIHAIFLNFGAKGLFKDD